MNSNDPVIAGYGAWPSPISAADLVSGAVGISEVCVDGTDIWWAESRPNEAGRTAVMRWGNGQTTEMTPPGANVRTLVHEYGGGAWWADRGVLYYVDYSDQRLRRLEPGQDAVMLTPEPPIKRGLRYADGRVSPDGRWFVCVRERHSGCPDETLTPRTDAGVGGSANESTLAGGENSAAEPINELVAVATDSSGIVNVLWAGADFVSSPRISPDGTLIAWVSWDHPNMPWDATTLRVHQFSRGCLGPVVFAIGNGTESWLQPDWTPNNELLACSDRNEWWSLYRINVSGIDPATRGPEPVIKPVIAGPYDIATPPWVFGMQRWAVDGSHTVAVAAINTGDELVINGATVATVDTSIECLRAISEGVVYAGSGYGSETEVVRLRIRERGIEREVISSKRALPVGTDYLIEPESITFRTGTTHGATGEESRTDSSGDCAGSPVAHGLYYRPTNPDHVGAPDERPPLLVLAHGGPTGRARRTLQLGILYWTSRGIAVVDVDYRGSTGYGRTYRRALEGQWGIADVEDCVSAARFLAERGDVDPDRMMIRGGSAGGFTVLSALAFHDVFAAGASRYGVADLEALATDTHKFESRYLDTLIGRWPEDKQTYERRSPINHLERFNTPMIVLQGAEDVIVAPNQSEMVVAALQERSVPVCYLLFEGEQHGFRRAESLITALEAELRFFGEILGFIPDGNLPDIKMLR